jgi:hypothetical protein
MKNKEKLEILSFIQIINVEIEVKKNCLKNA